MTRADQLRRYYRCAVAIRLHNTWLDDFVAESINREERISTIMSMREYSEMTRELTDKERAGLHDVLVAIPANLRADLDAQQYRLGSDLYRVLGAEDRRRVAEIRCWLIDAIDSLDEGDYGHARSLVVDALHQLRLLHSRRPQNDRPSRRRIESDPLLRGRMQEVIVSLERNANSLKAVAS